MPCTMTLLFLSRKIDTTQSSSHVKQYAWRHLDAIPASLTGAPGDPARGKAIVVSRQTGLCLLCHSAPLPEEKFQGTIGPDLKGAGSRNTEGQLRLRIVDSRIFNPDTIMPSYYRLDGLERVAPAFRRKTVLTAEQIEDVVAFLETLHD